MAVTDVPASIRSWAARPGAAALLRLAREKVETGRSGPRTRLPVPDADRADVGRMLGVTWEVSGAPVTLGTLRGALERAGTTLEAVLIDIGGPLRNAAAAKLHVIAEHAEQRTRTAAILTEVGVPEPVATKALRWLGPTDQALAVAEQVAAAWAALPHSPMNQGRVSGAQTVGLAAFASKVLGDPHALDRDQPAGRALVRILATIHSSSTSPGVAASRGDALNARLWRATWLRVGVLCDQVSSTVLVLNLPLVGRNRALWAVTTVPGEPLWVTSRLTAGGCSVSTRLSSPLVVRVCENPAVMEAAVAKLGDHCPPLVCLYGRPSSAGWDVLDAVVDGGGRLLVSADRDAAGRQIVADLQAAYPDGVSEWEADAPGLYEEQRLPALIADLSRTTAAPRL